MPDPTGRGTTRRQFLKLSAGAAGSAVVADLVGFGVDTSRVQASAHAVPIKQGKQIPSLCPYCAVGCGQIITVGSDGKIIDIQGNPDSPINQGTLCPKGAATFQLVTNALRWTRVKHRTPGSDHWEDMSLEDAMTRIAQLFKQTRDANFNETQDMPDGKGGVVNKRVMNTYAIASLGGATMDNEWNYLHQKLLHSLGVVYLENQARI
jgi:formate dehydrogenase major subunit